MVIPRYEGWVSSSPIEPRTQKPNMFGKIKGNNEVRSVSNGTKRWHCHILKVTEEVLKDIENEDAYADDIFLAVQRNRGVTNTNYTKP